MITVPLYSSEAEFRLSIVAALNTIAPGGTSWGGITGTLASQTDLQTALNLKATLASPTFTGTVALPAGQVVNGVTLTTAGGTSNFLRADGTYALPAGGGGNPVWTSVEKNLGTAPARSGSFTIAGSGLTTGKPVIISQAVGPYTGKGTLADEYEMDAVNVAGSVTSATVIQCYWNSPSSVRGNLKFNYLIGA